MGTYKAWLIGAMIANAVGFNDPTVFSRAFKKWTGMPPQEYRRNIDLRSVVWRVMASERRTE